MLRISRLAKIACGDVKHNLGLNAKWQYKKMTSNENSIPKQSVDPSLFYSVAQKGVAAFRKIAVEAYNESGVSKANTTEPSIDKLSGVECVTYYVCLPGVKKGHIKVDADGNSLEIIARRESPFTRNPTSTGEIAYGELKRTIDMGNLFIHSQDQISSYYEDGMLVLVISRNPSGKINVEI